MLYFRMMIKLLEGEKGRCRIDSQYIYVYNESLLLIECDTRDGVKDAQD